MGYSDNLLPLDGSTYYFGSIFSKAKAEDHFVQLLEKISWANDEVVIFGKRIITARKTAWYGSESFEYTYSNVTRKAQAWIPELLPLKEKVEKLCGLEFNSCLLNLYHSGEEGMAWHSDDESELGNKPAIASLSFGAQRKFVLKHKVTGEKVALQLEPGSLLLMTGDTQKNWVHSLPKTKKVKEPRINLTFRNIKKWKSQ